MSEPQTAAGRALLRDWTWESRPDNDLVDDILAIEAEARAAVLDEARAAVEGQANYAPGANNHEWRRGVKFMKDRALAAIDALREGK